MATLSVILGTVTKSIPVAYCPTCGFVMLETYEHEAGCCLSCSMDTKQDNGISLTETDYRQHCDKENLMLLIEEQHPEFSLWDPAQASEPLSTTECEELPF